MLVIEHLEPLSEWVWAEYSNISEYWNKDVLFTNVKIEKEKRRLEKLGQVEKKSVTELKAKFIILDLKGTKPLTTEDFKLGDPVIGGICGNFEPTGRTWDLITSKLKNPIVRHLGEKHLTTDTAGIAIKMIKDGEKIENLKFTDSVEIQIDEITKVELPYGYLLVNGTPRITPGLFEVLEKELNSE